MILIYIFYKIIMILGESILLGASKLGDEVLGVYCVDTKNIECISDEEFMLYGRHEFWLELVMIHVELLF